MKISPGGLASRCGGAAPERASVVSSRNSLGVRVLVLPRSADTSCSRAPPDRSAVSPQMRELPDRREVPISSILECRTFLSSDRMRARGAEARPALHSVPRVCHC